MEPVEQDTWGTKPAAPTRPSDPRGRALVLSAIAAFLVAAFVPVSLVEPYVPESLGAYVPFIAGGAAWICTFVLAATLAYIQIRFLGMPRRIRRLID